MWLSRHTLNNSLVVFIHGIFGSRWTTWRSYVNFFQGLPSEHPLLRSYDVYLFEYETRGLRQPPLYPNVVNQLGQFLAEREQRDKYETVVFVCHSQGGIVGKRYVLRELMEQRGLELKVDLIITLCTPHQGVGWLNGLRMLRSLPGVRNGNVLRQLADLASTSENVEYLRKYWREPWVTPRPYQAARARRHIHSVAITGLKDLVVSAGSSIGFEVDFKDDMVSGHSVDSEKVINLVARRYLMGHADPFELEQQLKRTQADPVAFAQCQNQYCNEALQIIALERQGADPSYRQFRPFCFVHDFWNAFPRHPMRKLDLPAAFKTYVKRCLQD